LRHSNILLTSSFLSLYETGVDSACKRNEYQ